jgi:3-phenylpropionate/trans-cinnamate dioxygenase ferredoxin reductase component
VANRVIIVGAGQGGLQAAESLRSKNYQGEIVLCGDEAYAPYHRPPLSKGLLLGEMTQEQLTIRQAAVFEKKQITLKTNCSVNAINRHEKSVTMANGEKLSYDYLILATGALPRALPFDTSKIKEGLHSLRTLNDTLAIQSSISLAKNVVIIGGGFIGLEMAAVARKLGKQVTVVEYADRLMARVVSPEVSAFYKQLHENHGCQLLLNCKVTQMETNAQGKVIGVSLNTGVELPAYMVVSGIGVIPNTALAEQAGLHCEHGIITDRSGITNDPAIFAIGDCSAQQRADGTLLRLESVQNAVEMAKACAEAITGGHEPFVAAPWFWSDQYDVKLQMVGLSTGYDQIVLRGDVKSNKFSYFYFKNELLLAIDSINASADHMAGRKLLASANTLTPEQAADVDFELKTVL